MTINPIGRLQSAWKLIVALPSRELTRFLLTSLKELSLPWSGTNQDGLILPQCHNKSLSPPSDSFGLR